MNMVELDEKYMRLAIAEAEKAQQIGEVPIGALIVQQEEIISTGFNKRETTQLASTYAERIAIDEAKKKVGSWRLEDGTLYVTLESCTMCAGAIIQTRIKRVVFGSTEPKAGCAVT